MKIVRNLSQHEETLHLRLEHIKTLLYQITEEQHEDFVLEVLGTLSNLRQKNLDWSLVMEEFKDLMPFLLKRLNPETVEDDLALEVVLMIRTLSVDKDCAFVLSQSGVIPALVNLIKERQIDDEFVCQIISVFYHMAFHKETRDTLLQDEQISMFLFNLMHDTNPQVCSICDQTLDVLSASDKPLLLKVQQERFNRHNTQWLNMIQEWSLLLVSEEAEDNHLYSPSEPHNIPLDELLCENGHLSLDPFEMGY